METLPKRTRLEHFDYQGHFAYSVTINTHKQNRYFESGENVSLLLAILDDCCRQDEFMIYGYCFMPDHLHLLVQGLSETADLKKFCSRFKQKSGYQFKRKHGQMLWQPSYYDHVLRKTEDLKPVLEYILFNPVRAGLVADFKEYPYSGSIYVKK